MMSVDTKAFVKSLLTPDLIKRYKIIKPDGGDIAENAVCFLKVGYSGYSLPLLPLQLF